MEVDVLIVGAGPAGSTTARYCAGRDTSVLMIDRRREIGQPVQCGEFFPSAKEMYSMFPRSTDLEDLFRIDEGVVVGHVNHIDLVSPRGRTYRCPFEGVALDRRSFDKSLVKLAVEAGAELRAGTSLLSVDDGIARTTIGDIGFKVLIGADGPNSRTAREVGLERPLARYPAVTCHAEGNFDPAIKMYFGSVAPGGYAWVIPKRKGANIGAGFNPKTLSRHPSAYFQEFVARLGVPYRDVTMGFVPLSGPTSRTVGGNTMLVGDAAGHVMSSNGGGIPIAMIAGRIAGRTVKEHLRGGLPLAEYEPRWRSVLEKPLASSLWTRKLGDLFFPADRRMEFAMRVLGVRGLARAIRCKKVFYLF
ncbi:MAG: NAD(P)/FAD-dependent oxidoreductase [Candidatus Thermoplasmatota archaeon]|nr:NAD(P)/FAD-dependent oxidoreductase [Candidatus Thermoplasmatota archaeon]